MRIARLIRVMNADSRIQALPTDTTTIGTRACGAIQACAWSGSAIIIYTGAISTRTISTTDTLALYETVAIATAAASGSRAVIIRATSTRSAAITTRTVTAICGVTNTI